MFDDLDTTANHATPKDSQVSSNDQLLISINQDHNQHSSQLSDNNSTPLNFSYQSPSTDPTLDLTTANCNYKSDSNNANHLIINENETILPDVTCVTPGNYNMSIHSYGSNHDGENQPLLKRIDNDSTQIINNTFLDDPEFNSFVKEIEQAIENGFLPKRIYQGSSGSYFVKNTEGNV